MFERMLVGLDSSPHSPTVLAAAKDLAVKSGSVVMVAHIRDVAVPLAMAASAGRPGMRRDVAPLEDEHFANRLVEDAVQAFREASVDAEGRVGTGWGATAKELLRLGDEFGANIIVVGSHGSQVTQILLGSVAYRIVHQAPCPVLVVR